MKFCIGTFFTLLKICKVKNIQQKELISALIKGIDDQFLSKDDDSGLSAITRGARGLSRDAVEGARIKDVVGVAEYFESEILPMLDFRYSKVIVLAIIDMLSKDSEISSYTIVDVYSGMSKENVISCKNFNFSEFLAGIYLYLAANRDIKGVQKVVKEVNKAYIDGLWGKEGYIEVCIKRNVTQCTKNLLNETTQYDATLSFDMDIFIASILGEWDENYSGDKEIIMLLTGKNFDAFIERIREFFGKRSIRIEYKEGHWIYTDRKEYLDRFRRSILDEVLVSAQKAFQMIVMESKPRFDLPGNQRMYAEAFGKKNHYSDSIRKGMAWFWAYVGFNKSVMPSCSAEFISNIYYTIVNDIFGNNWKIIAGEKDVFSLLAEGDPEIFLTVLERNLTKSNSSVIVYFNEQENNITTINYGAELVLTLEMLALYDGTFQRSAALLFELAEYSNFAFEILSQLLYPGNPVIYIQRDIKIGLLKGLFVENMERAWKLYTTTLPLEYFYYKPKNQPYFLPMINMKKTLLISDCYDDSIGYYSVAVDYMCDNYENCVDMVKAANKLPLDIACDIFCRITDAINSFSDNERYCIWNAARQILFFQKKNMCQSGKSQGELNKKYEEFIDKIKPSGAEEKELFKVNQYELYDLFDNYNVALKELQKRQCDVIRRIYEKYGIKGIQEFANKVENFALVGKSLAHVKINEQDFSNLSEKLVLKETGEYKIASSFFNELYFYDNTAIKRAEGIESYLIKEKVLANYRMCDAVLELVKVLPSEIEEVYWKEVYTYNADVTIEYYLHYIIEKLTSVGRFDDAMFLLIHKKTNKYCNELIDAVYHMLIFYDNNGKNPDIYLLQETIKWFQEYGEHDRIIEIEWKYFNFMSENNNLKPRTIFFEISNNPDTFIEIIQHAYKGKNDIAKENIEIEKRISSQCYSVLWKWKQIPGCKNDGTFSIEVLNSWIKSVVPRLEEMGIKEIGMEHIGETLFYAPADNNFFVNRDVAMLLQMDKEGYYRRGYEVEALNSIGVHEVNKNDLLEFKLEKEYLSKADEAAKNGYFRFAETLKSIANELHSRGEWLLK